MSGMFAKRWSRVALGAAVLVVVAGGAATAGAVLASGAPAGATSHDASPANCSGRASITETGTGTVSITPNLLTLSLDVVTTASQASSALSHNEAVTGAVVHALFIGGVARRDLQTTDLTIQPKYADTGTTTITGYSVDDTVVAKIRKFSTAGTLVDAAVAAGGDATRIDSLSFSLTQPLRAQEQARALAVRQASGHAKAIAESAGETIGGICSIDDQTTTSTTSPIVPFASASTAATPNAHVPVESGSETVTARVTIVFALG